MTEETLFAQAVELPVEERSAFLEEACGNDAELRERVGILLRSHDDAGTFLAKSVGEEFEATLDLSVDDELLRSAQEAELEKSFAQKTEWKEHEPASVHRIRRPDGRTVLYFGDYELQGEIARGAMGVVYRAEQKSLKRIVAIKMIRSTLLASDDDVNRFRAEAEAAASLDHPNIVPIYEVGEYEEQQYFSMKLIEGGTLREQLPRLRQNSRAAATMMTTIAHAIHSAHQRGILHRDIKPGNILIDEDGEPHLTDFGLAKQIESSNSMTLSGQIMGTPNYMAPEQAEGGGKDLTTAAEVYALRAVFYEMLTGQPPHRGDSLMETLRLVAEEDPAKPRSLDTSIDRDLETIALKCLEKDPAKRYASAQGMANELELWLRGEPISARPVGTGERVVKWMKRKPVHASAAGLAVMLLLTLGIGGPIAALQQTELRKAADEEKARADEAAGLADVRAEEIRENLYASEMIRAQTSAGQRGGAIRIQAILDHWRPEGSEPDLRGWEWYFARSLLERAELALPHPAPVNVATCSRDGRLIYTGCEDSKVRIWDVKNGQMVKILTEHPNRIHSLAVSPDGRHLASGSSEGTVRVTDLGDEKVTVERKGAHISNHSALAWSPDGSAIAFHLQKQKLGVIDAESGAVLESYDLGTGVRSVSWSHDGIRHAVATPDGVTILNRITRERIDFKGPGVGSNFAVWDRSGNLLVNYLLQTFLLKPPHFSRKEFVSFPGGKGVKRADLSEDGDRYIFSSEDRSIVQVDARTGTVTDEQIGHLDVVADVEWSPDGERFLSAGSDSVVRVWKGQSNSSALAGVGFGRSVAWHPTRDSLAIGHTRRLLFMDSPDQPSIKSFPLPGEKRNHVRTAWSPQGERLAFCSGSTAEIWSGRDPSEPLQLDLPENPGEGDALGKPAWEPNGERLLITNRGREVWLYSAKTGERLDQWEARSQWGVWSAIWHPDGGRFALFHRGRIEIRNADTGEVENAWSFSNILTSMAWHPSGKYLATSRSDDLLVEIWSLQEGRKIDEIQGATMLVPALDWSPDGTVLAIGSHDSVLRLWDLEKQQIVCSLEEAGMISDLDWDPDGLRLAVTTSEGLVIRDASRGFLAENSPRALSYLDRKIRVTPTSVLPRIQRAELLEKLQRQGEADAERELVAAIIPGHPREEAITKLEARLEADREDSHAAVILADLLLKEAMGDGWTPLQIKSAVSEGGADLVSQSDGSILATGKNPPGDVYLVSGHAVVSMIRAIRIETIPDARLPESGSGRAWDGCFQLGDFSIIHRGTPSSIAVAWTSLPTKPNMTIERAFDEDPDTGWDPYPHQREPHTAIFELAEPLEFVEGADLSVRLQTGTRSGKFPKHNLGRFRLSVSDSPRATQWADLRQRLHSDSVLENGSELLDLARSLRNKP